MAIRFDRIELSDDGNHLYPYLEGTDGYLAIRTTSGLTRIGPGNSSYSHFYTDRPNYYFNVSTSFDGHVSAYGGDENLTNWNNVDASAFRSKANTAYLLDPDNTGTSLKVAGDIEIGGSHTISNNSNGHLDIRTNTSGKQVFIKAHGQLRLDSGNAQALTLDSSQNATFAGEISAGDDINTTGKLFANATNAELRLKSTNNSTGTSLINFADSDDNDDDAENDLS